MTKNNRTQKRREQRKRAEMRALDITPQMVDKAIDYLMVQDSPVPKTTSLSKMKEKKMAHAYATANLMTVSHPTEHEQAKSHLSYRLMQITGKKTEDLQKHFHLADDEAPKTPKQLIDRIKEGKFKVRKPDHSFDDTEDYLDSDRYSAYHLMSYFNWRDPDHKKDHKGYDAAIKKLEKAVEHLNDTLVVAEAKDGLIALREFEEKKFH